MQDDTFTIEIPATSISSSGLKGSVYWSIYLLTLTCGEELWGVTETIRSATRMSGMGLLGRAARLRITDTSEELRHSCL